MLILKIKLFFAKLSPFKRRFFHYISSPETLPPPLCAEDEQLLAERSQSGEKEARASLIEHNLRLVVYIAKKFDNTGINIEDLISIGTIGLIKAVNTFKADKSIKLATYASRCIENEILMYLRKNSSHRMDISIDEPLNTDGDGNELLLADILQSDEGDLGKRLENELESELLKRALDSLSPREKQIMELRFGFCGREFTQKEVADMLNISQSYISRLEKKIFSKLKKELLRIS